MRRAKYAVEGIVRHVGDGESVRYAACRHGYPLVDNSIELPEHIAEDYVTCYWRRMKESDTVQQGRGKSQANRKKLLKWLTLTKDSNAEDEISINR